MGFQFYKQLNGMDCGPACLQMIAKYYGKYYSLNTLKQHTSFSRQGVSLSGISLAAEKIGFESTGLRLSFESLTKNIDVPFIAHWNKNHFIVVLSLPSWFKNKIVMADPATGILSLSKRDFINHWAKEKSLGNILVLKPTPEFYGYAAEKETALNWKIVTYYLTKNLRYIVQVLIAMVIGSFLQLLLPILAKQIVDSGIHFKDLNFITIILIAQLIIVLSRSIAEFIRSGILLRLSVIMNLTILSDFWVKLTKLPIAYFDRHQAGDIIQRIGDNKKIQSFFTNSAITTLLSLVNLVIFSWMIAVYQVNLFYIFSAGSVLYFLWINLFFNVRRKLNYQTFQVSAKENNSTLQLIHGMADIKLNNAEVAKRWEWENLQVEIGKLNIRELIYEQFQQGGATLINQGKDVIITFLVAQAVIQGTLTLGTMLAIQYILGQLSYPIEQLVTFFRSAQDAKISMERLNEIHRMPEEENPAVSYKTPILSKKGIKLEKVSFYYPGDNVIPVLSEITLTIPAGKITAIVGDSGSGKTTLIKLLLKYYTSYSGDIYIGDDAFPDISPLTWRRQCGAVLQDGYIFNDTIARNIAVSEDFTNEDKLIEACKNANILAFIQSLPNGFETALGTHGINISQGQKQRILISRALYKNPYYLFFDEATNALDANNEKIIVENLNQIFQGKTVVVVAHRLSTVRNADNIIVLHDGRVAETGNHFDLTLKKGKYYELVKNQMDSKQIIKD